MPAPLNPTFTIRTSDEVANGEPIGLGRPKGSLGYHYDRDTIAGSSDRLLNALHRAFHSRVETRGCSFIYAQTYLMNGVEP